MRRANVRAANALLSVVTMLLAERDLETHEVRRAELTAEAKGILAAVKAYNHERRRAMGQF